MRGVSNISPQSLALWCAGLLIVGCSSGSGGDSNLKGLGSGGTMSSTGGSSTGASGGTGGTGIVIGGGGDAGSGGDAGGAGGDTCGDVTCELGERCEENAGSASCVKNECSDLTCKDTEECQAASGGGHFCADISCESDVDCPMNRFCDGKVCSDDTCEPGSRTCDGNSVILCAANGSDATKAYSCESAGYFTSQCDDSTLGNEGCSCEDEWDCPEYTRCESGTCAGRGTEPTCTLPPTPFEKVLPALEFRWGGTDKDHPDATGHPFAFSGQVATTPLVVNLDDDNADGKVDELDFPEIVFMSYPYDSHDPATNGIIRSVHGGGPNKGDDYFALCGDKHWLEGDPLTDDCNVNDARARPAGTLAVGDLDYDGFPEIVVPLEDGRLQILDNKGQIITTYEADLRFTGPWNYPAPAIANLDFKGLAEIVLGNRVLTLKKTGNALEIDRVFSGDLSDGTMVQSGEEDHHHGPTVCLADLKPDSSGLEIVAGTTVYRLPEAPADCDAPNDTTDYCQGKLSVVWDAATVNPGNIDYQNGFCAVADVWGADHQASPGPGNKLDGKPEVVLISDGELLVLDGATGALILSRDLKGGSGGGAPNVDDFDGDGFPEIATALADFYTVIDLQDPSDACPAWDTVLSKTGAPPEGNPARNPGGSCKKDADCTTPGTVCNTINKTCVCLHNGWQRDTEDDSSRVTSSSVFDFNGDGAAEVVYNDECYFHIYDGTSGRVYLALPSLSRTIDENPVVADLDNDGNAEIVFAQNNETIQCSEKNLDSWPDGDNDVPSGTLPNGIAVYGDPTDVWVAARRIWNQHGYHVTNVTEGGSIPLHEPESWKPLNGRLYNTFRSQPRSYGVAPDLALTGIQIASPDAACGELSDTIEIAVEVENKGDLRVGPGVVITFDGSWKNPTLNEALEDKNGDPLTVTLQASLEPGASTIVTVEYKRGRNSRDDLPVTITATIDGDDGVRECDEDNNSIKGKVEAGAEVADLTVNVDAAKGCSPPSIDLTVTNEGSAAASDITVRIYAGDPSQGGELLGETTVDGPVAPGDSASVTAKVKAISRDVQIYAVVNPLKAIPECNYGNNTDKGPQLHCAPITR
jgi:hypothetical protein